MQVTTQLRGYTVVDVAGRKVGKVRDTWPQDGGGETELMLVDVGHRLTRPRWLPVSGSRTFLGCVHVPWERHEIVDAPSAEDHRWGDPAHVARAYWVLADD